MTAQIKALCEELIRFFLMAVKPFMTQAKLTSVLEASLVSQNVQRALRVEAQLRDGFRPPLMALWSGGGASGSLMILSARRGLDRPTLRRRDRSIRAIGIAARQQAIKRAN